MFQGRNRATVQSALSTASDSPRAVGVSANRPSAVPEQHNQPDGPYGISGCLSFWCPCNRHIQICRQRQNGMLAAVTWRVVCQRCQREYTVGIVVSEDGPDA